MCPIKMEACRQRETDKQEMEAPDAKKAERDCRVTAVDQARRTEPAGKRGSKARRRLVRRMSKARRRLVRRVSSEGI